jgi:uncharacterized protein
MTFQPEVTSGAEQARRPGGEPFDPVGVSWNRVSTKLATARRITGSLLLAVPTVALLVPAFGLGSWWWPGPLVPLLVAAWWWWLAGRQVRAVGYAERDDDLLVRRGIMRRQIVVVPYGRLQYVDVQAGPVDRIFGIARVQLHTASAATDAVIPGLPPAEAARVRDRLAARGQARLAGL